MVVRLILKLTLKKLNNKNQLGFSVIELVLLSVMLAAVGSIGFIVYRDHAKVNYQAQINNFITDVQNKNKTKADSLESPAFKAYSQKIAGNTSFYDACQRIGSLCTPLFDASFINKATKTYQDYKSSSGTKGKQITYTLKQSLSGSAAGGQGCSSESTNTLVIAVVPHGNTWLIDSVTPTINANANLCSVSGSQSTISTPSTSPPASASKSTSGDTKNSTRSNPTPEPSPTPSKPSGTVTVSDDGCYVAAWGIPGMTLTITVQKSGGGGGQASYAIPAAGAIEEASGGSHGETTFGSLYSGSTLISSDSAVITASLCPPGT